MEEHLRAVASIASGTLSFIGLPELGYLLGLVHDLGKYTDKFDSYIRRAAAGEKVKRGSVNHTFAGVVFIWQRYHDSSDMYGKLLCELICCAIGSHHGLFDCVDPEGKSGFLHRLKKDRTEFEYDEAVERFLHFCAGYEEIDRLFANAKRELTALLPALEKRFYCFALERLLLSALIDADRADTARFMLNGEEKTEALGAVAEAAFSNLEKRINGFACISAVQKSRRAFSDMCLSFAERPGGVYKLALPTGAGKTLASLRYALAKAKLDPARVKRIFYVAPLLTVLEQNAEEIRESVGRPDWVLEHHSNVILDSENCDELARYELLAENWSAPIVVTTLVQLLNTLFSGKTTCIRRMQALCGAVIIIDEIQSLPIKTLSIFNGMINFLTKACGATVVLCSATQPELADESIALKLDFARNADIVPFDGKLWAPFERTDIVDHRSKYGMDTDEIADLAVKQLSRINSVLLICNTRKSAADIYNSIKKTAPEGTEVIHLSAAMCQKHRFECLDRIKKAIDPASGKKVVCVSTQLIEAGVDISFGCVIRTIAGLDSIAQAAGRCNRHGELMIDGAPAHGKVMIIDNKNESITFLKEIEQAQQACSVLLDDFAGSPQSYDNSLLSTKAVSKYYSQLYLQINAASGSKTEYPVALETGPTTIYDLLSKNRASYSVSGAEVRGMKTILNQAFKTAGDQFEVFDENSSSVIVPYDGAAEEIINKLSSITARDLRAAKQLIEAAKPYTVTVYAGIRTRLEAAGALLHCCDGEVLAVNPGMREFYDEETGLTIPKTGGEAYVL